MRTVYLGTSSFAAAVLERLTRSDHRPQLVVTRPDRPKGRGRRSLPPPVAEGARKLGIPVIQPEDLHAPETLREIAAARPDLLCLCAYGVLVREALLARYLVLNVHPSLLPRWRGAAPIERAIMAGDEETGVSIMELTAGLDSGPVSLQEPEPILPDDDYGTLSARLERLSGELLVQALDERPPFRDQPEEGVTYAERIEAADRAIDVTRTPQEEERRVRALRPHIGARLPVAAGGFLGVDEARADGPTLAPAGGRMRPEDGRLLLDCHGGALELVRVQPPSGKPMAAAEWLRGRPDPALVDFRLDPALPDLELEDLVERAQEQWGSGDEWAPAVAALAHRGTADVLAAARELARAPEPSLRALGAYLLGQLGQPERTEPAVAASVLERMAESETHPYALAAIAHAFGHLGAPHGLERLLALRRHPDAEVREGVAHALTGRPESEAVAALEALSADPDRAIREWATFGLGTLAADDDPAVHEALVRRLHDEDEDTRVEAVHGLARRGDGRALEPALSLLERGSRDGAAAWKRHALEEAAIRLGALTGDRRLERFLPEPSEYAGTTLEGELRRAYARTA